MNYLSYSREKRKPISLLKHHWNFWKENLGNQTADQTHFLAFLLWLRFSRILYLSKCQHHLPHFIFFFLSLTTHSIPTSAICSKFKIKSLFLFTSPAMILVKATIILHLFYFDSSISLPCLLVDTLLSSILKTSTLSIISFFEIFNYSFYFQLCWVIVAVQATHHEN